MHFSSNVTRLFCLAVKTVLLPAADGARKLEEELKFAVPKNKRATKNVTRVFIDESEL